MSLSVIEAMAGRVRKREMEKVSILYLFDVTFLSLKFALKF